MSLHDISCYPLPYKSEVYNLSLLRTYNVKYAKIRDLANLKGITFGSINICSLLPKVGEIAILLNQSNLDFLYIQESFLSDLTLDSELEIPNYNFGGSDRDTNVCQSFGGGIVTDEQAE